MPGYHGKKAAERRVPHTAWDPGRAPRLIQALRASPARSQPSALHAPVMQNSLGIAAHWGLCSCSSLSARLSYLPFRIQLTWAAFLEAL